MDTPSYVLELNEAVLMPTKQSGLWKALRVGVLCIFIIIALGSFVFDDNLFFELSWVSRVLLITVAITVFFSMGKNEMVPSPMELRFYDDYMVIYRPKRYYNSRVTRMEYNKLMYNEITKCVYRERSQRMYIYGNVDATWFNYMSDGTIPKEPTYKRIVSGTFCHFSLKCAEGVDIKREIEMNSPLEVIVENS